MKTPLTFLTCLITFGCMNQGWAKHLLVSEKALATNNVSVSETINNNGAVPKDKAPKLVTTPRPEPAQKSKKNAAATMNPYLSISFTPEAAMTSLYYYGYKQSQNISHT